MKTPEEREAAAALYAGTVLGALLERFSRPTDTGMWISLALFAFLWGYNVVLAARGRGRP